MIDRKRSIKNVRLRDKILLFDYNHTLVNTAAGHLQAMEAMLKTMREMGFSRKETHEIVKRVHYTTSLMIAGFLIHNEDKWRHVPGGKEAYKEILFKINDYQKGILKRWGFIKKWSREVFLKMAADDIGIKLSSKSIKKIVDEYWRHMSRVRPSASARIIFKELKKQKIPVFVLTSSDGRLHFTNGQFSYDPVFSENAKRQRLQELRNDIFFEDFIIGDPEDKPAKEFFLRGIKEVSKKLQREVEAGDFVMVGNSYDDDLKTPLETLGFGAGILLEEGRKLKQVNNSLFLIGNLRGIAKLI